MIMILAFAVWSLLLAVVAVATGLSSLIYAATAIGLGAVGFALVVLVVAIASPEPVAGPSYGANRRGASAAA
jgi:hypothetical protein